MSLLQGKSQSLGQSHTKHEEKIEELGFSPEVKGMIRKKINSYLHCQLDISPHYSKQVIISKKNRAPLPKDYPEYATLLNFFREEKTVYHLYKEKIDRNLDQSQYFFFKVISLAMEYECRVSKKEIDRESSVMIDGFLFLASSLLEVGADKAAFYFASIAVQFCEFYKVLHPIGEFMLIMAKISRRHFRYKESILMLKKALEYNWWRDGTRSESLNAQFLNWMMANNPDKAQFYQQKFEICRMFSAGEELPRAYKSVSSSDIELPAFRELFQQFLEANKIRSEDHCYDVCYQRHRDSSDKHADNLEIEIYNQLSFNFLQLNMKEESKIFGEKYESGYLEPEDSKIIALSSELIHSIQRRIAGWHRINRKSFELLFYVDLFDIVAKHRYTMRSIDQEQIINLFRVRFESSFDGLMNKQMFSYEIPLPLEIRRDVPKMKKKTDGRKFIVRQRSITQLGKQPAQVIKDKYKPEKVEENLLLNYRGSGVSRLKLLGIYGRFMEAVREREKQGSFRAVDWTQKC